MNLNVMIEVLPANGNRGCYLTLDDLHKAVIQVGGRLQGGFWTLDVRDVGPIRELAEAKGFEVRVI